MNSVYGVRSTGKLVAEAGRALIREGHDVTAAYGREAKPDGVVPLMRIGTDLDARVHAVMSRLFDAHGLWSRRATRRFLRQVEALAPELIWLHNIHGYYLNYEMLFAWLRRHPEIRVRWTLHACWAFTGHCAYFTMAKCEKWRDACGGCPQLKTYPRTIGLDGSRRNLRRKQRAFAGVRDLTLITPSRWLADLTRESFLREYPVEVVHNEVDKTVFRPTPSDVRGRYGLGDRRVVLGVAVGWEETKGLPDMLRLRAALDERYVVVLVGVTDAQRRRLPAGVVGIGRTADQRELAAIYTAADVFVNPTHQDNYPTVNLEAAACGTVVITYQVGGSPESALPENVVPEGDIDALAARVRAVCGEISGA